MILTRLHPIEEAVRARPREIEWVLFDSQRRDRRINALKALCRSHGVAVRYGNRETVDRAAGGPHQGAVARIAVRGYADEAAALRGRRGARFLLLLDEIQDPQNLGAVLRVAEGDRAPFGGRGPGFGGGRGKGRGRPGEEPSALHRSS
jgi:23S rRNA (guanosine2251-2'-O)-methyltransferase